jgi:hypothetical protein
LPQKGVACGVAERPTISTFDTGFPSGGFKPFPLQPVSYRTVRLALAPWLPVLVGPRPRELRSEVEGVLCQWASTAFARLVSNNGQRQIFPKQGNSGGKCTVAEGERRNWRELCYAALEAKDPDELLKIVQELNKALKREEQVRRDFREANVGKQIFRSR